MPRPEGGTHKQKGHDCKIEPDPPVLALAIIEYIPQHDTAKLRRDVAISKSEALINFNFLHYHLIKLILHTLSLRQSSAEPEGSDEMGDYIFHIIIIAAGVVSLVRGFSRGLTLQVPDLLGIAFGIVLARVAGESLEPTFAEHLPMPDNPVVEPFILATTTRTACLVAGYLLTRTLTLPLRSILRELDRGILDNLFGALFALFNAMIWCSTGLNLLLCLNTHGTLMRHATQDDGNVVELVALLAPSLEGCSDCQDLGHILQLEDAKKISLNIPAPSDVINIDYS